MISVDMRQVEQLAKQLERDVKSVKYAVCESLNTLAFGARVSWQGEMKRSLTLRNQYTERSVRVEKASMSGPIANMQSKVGSVADYMATTEAGGTEQGRGAEGYRMPSYSTKPKGQVAKHRFRMSRLTLTHPDVSRFSSARQKIAVAARMARVSGSKSVFLNISPSERGMYQLQFKGKRRLKMRTIWDMRRQSIRIHPHATLGPTLQEMNGRFAVIATEAFRKQLERRKAFGL